MGSAMPQVVVKHGPLQYLCKETFYGWLCGKCRGLIRPVIRHKCGKCGAMVIEVVARKAGWNNITSYEP